MPYGWEHIGLLVMIKFMQWLMFSASTIGGVD
jgi:hypothetical protein